MSVKYDEYITEHKENVLKGFNWLCDHLPEVFLNANELFLELIVYNHIVSHDKSKDHKDEYESYDAYFYGENKSYKVVEAFNYAWLNHIHRNPHHWQHWVLINDDPENGEKILDMPDEYIIEMICDWWSFSWKKGDLFEIFNWYEERKSYIKLSEKTRNKVENILRKMKDKLKGE